MAVLKTKMQGDSMSIGIAFNAEYDTSRIENHYLYLNNKLFTTTLINGIVRAELTSEQTKAFIGNVRLTVVIDDIHFGVRKTDVGYIEFKTTPTIYDQSINEGYDLIVTMTVNESETGVSVVVLEAFRGYSSYDIYVKYTTDDPILTEEEWTVAVNQAKTDAETAAAAALLSEQNAKESELTALGYKNTAGQQAVIATTQAGISITKAGESFDSSAAALISEQHSKTSEDNAKDSETASGISATNAAGSAVTAGQQATIATNKANEALGYRNEAEGFSQTANTRAGEANLSAIDAADSAQDALDYRNAAEQIVSAYFLYNITVAIPLTAGNYYTLTTAIAATPVNVRKLGLVITFEVSAGVWETWQFVGGSWVVESFKLIADTRPFSFDYWGFMWVNEQADDKVTFINDLAAVYTQDYAPTGSKRAAYLDRLRPCEINPMTNVFHWLANNVNYLADGITPSNVANPDWLQFTYIPEIYLSYSYVNGNHVLLFSDTYKYGWVKYSARLRARYRGTQSGGKLLSYANNQNPTTSQSVQTNQAQARLTASWLDINDYYTYYLQTMLMTADCGRFNHQYYWEGATAASTTYAASIPCGKTNAMNLSNGNGAVYNVSGSNVTPFRWRFIENPYGGIWDELIGLYAVHAENEVKQRAFATMNRNLFTTNNDYSQYTLIGEYNRVGGWIKEWLGGTILPNSIGGSSTLYKCDYTYNNEGSAAFIRSVISGGSSGDRSEAGSFYLYSSWSVAYTTVTVGASLTATELPEIIKNQLI